MEILIILIVIAVVLFLILNNAKKNLDEKIQNSRYCPRCSAKMNQRVFYRGNTKCYEFECPKCGYKS